MNDQRAKSVREMGERGGTRIDSESGSIREVMPRVGISESPTIKEGGSEMWEDRDWRVWVWVWREIGCVMREGGEMRGVERAEMVRGRWVDTMDGD